VEWGCGGELVVDVVGVRSNLKKAQSTISFGLVFSVGGLVSKNAANVVVFLFLSVICMNAKVYLIFLCIIKGSHRTINCLHHFSFAFPCELQVSLLVVEALHASRPAKLG
jgi:hypothetical protein